jgi:hypothetical protein
MAQFWKWGRQGAGKLVIRNPKVYQPLQVVKRFRQTTTEVVGTKVKRFYRQSSKNHRWDDVCILCWISYRYDSPRCDKNFIDLGSVPSKRLFSKLKNRSWLIPPMLSGMVPLMSLYASDNFLRSGMVASSVGIVDSRLFSSRNKSRRLVNRPNWLGILPWWKPSRHYKGDRADKK